MRQAFAVRGVPAFGREPSRVLPPCEAIEADELTRAEALALAYDDDAIQLMAEREGLTHLLPLRRRRPADSRLRRIVWLLSPRAA